MQPVGQVLKTIMPMSISGSEVERYICQGCGQEVAVFELPIIGGPNKGKLTRQKRGCLCWEYEQAREAKREQRELQVDYMFKRFSTVNPELEGACFENYNRLNPELEEAYIKAFNYASTFSLDEPRNLLFSGMYGLGKSHLAYSICKVVREKGHLAIFISVPKLLTIIKSSFRNESSASEAELLEALSTVDFLVLDDLGAERVKKEEYGESWATEELFKIIDGRCGRHTLYTTNLSSDELRRKTGGRNFSRMMANTEPVRFEGKDYRIHSKRF